MSIIFKTLRKLNVRSNSGRSSSEPVQPKRPGYAVPRMMSPALMLMAVALIFATGYGTIYAFHYLKEKIQPSSSDVVTTKIVTKPVTLSEEEADILAEHSTQKQSAAASLTTPQIQYHPAREAQEQSGSATRLTDGKLFGNDDSLNHAGEVHSQSLPQMTDGFSSKRANVDSQDHTVSAAAQESNANRKDTLTQKIDPDERTAQSERLRIEAEQQKARKIQLAVFEKNARIDSLVERIKQSMAQGPSKVAQTSDLIDQLAHIKGHHHPYVAKLRAYWLIKQTRYKEAGRILQKVLNADETDLEAALNLALVEMHTGQYQQARDRLLALRQSYPHNTLINDMMEQLP